MPYHADMAMKHKKTRGEKLKQSIDHKAILKAYLSRIKDADLAVILEASKRHSEVAMNGNSRMQLDAINHTDKMIDSAVDNILEYDLGQIEHVVECEAYYLACAELS